MGLLKIAKKILLDTKHIKEDGKEFKEVKELSNKINRIVSKMQTEDKTVMRKVK